MSHPHSSQPSSLQLLGNGRYSVMLTDAGSGYSRWRNLAITRWREDPTRDHWGSYVLLRDLDTGVVWAPGRQPYGAAKRRVAATFEGGRSAFAHCDADLTTTLEVAVATDCDAEVRRVTLRNTSETARNIELTSYAELVLAAAAADAAHPAFSKLFVQTEWVAEQAILLATRRRRAPDEPEVWAAHCLASDTVANGSEAVPEYETDRARFLGRGRGLRHAQAMQADATLSNTVGTVLDPVFSLRRRLRVEAGASASIEFWTLAAVSRAAVLAQTDKVRSPGSGKRALAAATTHVAADYARFGIGTEEAEACRRLLAPLLYSDPAWRAPQDALMRGHGGAPVLWSAGISGDRPIAILRVSAREHVDRAERLLRAQRLWRSRWLGVDVVLLDTASRDAGAPLATALEALREEQGRNMAHDGVGASAEVFVLRDAEISASLREGLTTAARVLLEAAHDEWSPRTEQGIARTTIAAMRTPQSIDTSSRSELRPDAGQTPEFANGYGGFTAAGREYTIILTGGECTPAPWINVIANPVFGFIASAEGGGYTWALNSQQNALTPWPNDPVSDAPGEILYLRDEDSGALWSATAAPIRVADATYRITHGKGWSRFEHCAHGIGVELLQCVPLADPVKLSRLRLYNRSGRTRHLSVTGYVEWALGPNGANTAPTVVTEYDQGSGALFAGNAWRAEFGERIAFIDLGGAQTSCSGDRGEFLGRYGAVDAPAALCGAPLSGRVGAGLDPCGALQTRIELEPGARVELRFMLGEAASRDQAQALVQRSRVAEFDRVLGAVREHWNELLDTVQVHTPDRALDILLNDWLLYQTLACRVWARAGYYQASGAYGFRDQLQDVMALCVARPAVAREHLLRAAGRQFAEGDVQHWWLPPSGQGIRTRMSDDRLWLPYAAAHYVITSGDTAVLVETVPFLDGAMLEDGQGETFFQPTVGRKQASLYEHGARAIDISLTSGAHGLPLIGTGDWNDGMNRVGAQGRGESVWLAWFTIETIEAYAGIAEACGDDARLGRWRAYVDALQQTLESAGWDGDWYRRGYYDDGTVLGSAASAECIIDAIAQSWSALVKGSNPDHVAQAMQSLDAHLIREDEGLALLFTPPFDSGETDPGYIKGYPPGLRENGGQYTHGAIWSVFAFARLGQGDRAGALFSILNPILHGDSPEAIARYRVEPYAACADVYSVAPHVGRGGWTWYTGSAAWLYRAGIEAVLGFRVQGETLLLDPCIPAAWPGFGIVYRHHGTRYVIDVENPQHVQRGVKVATLDAEALEIDPCRVALRDDGASHHVKLVLGPAC